jgi:hypothetical protein
MLQLGLPDVQDTTRLLLTGSNVDTISAIASNAEDVVKFVGTPPIGLHLNFDPCPFRLPLLHAFTRIYTTHT